MNRPIRLIGAACTAGLLSVALGAGVASAHIDPDPPAVAAGSSATVGFTVTHGCDGSNTTQVAFKIPDGITDAAPVAQDGWTALAAANTVTFSGGNLDAETHGTFEITFTAPATPGTVYFPVVQSCQVGEIAWITIPAVGEAEPEHPAPALLVTDGPPTSADLAGSHDEEAGDDHTEDATAATSATNATNATNATTDDDGDDDNSKVGVIVAIIGGVVVVIGGGLIIASKRKK